MCAYYVANWVICPGSSVVTKAKDNWGYSQVIPSPDCTVLFRAVGKRRFKMLPRKEVAVQCRREFATQKEMGKIQEIQQQLRKTRNQQGLRVCLRGTAWQSREEHRGWKEPAIPATCVPKGKLRVLLDHSRNTQNASVWWGPLLTHLIFTWLKFLFLFTIYWARRPAFDSEETRTTNTIFVHNL